MKCPMRFLARVRSSTASQRARHWVQHRLLGRGRDADGHQLSATKLAGQAPGVALVAYYPVSGGERDKRWGDRLARHPERSQQPVQLVAGPPGLITGAQLGPAWRTSSRTGGQPRGGWLPRLTVGISSPAWSTSRHQHVFAGIEGYADKIARPFHADCCGSMLTVAGRPLGPREVHGRGIPAESGAHSHDSGGTLQA